MGDFGEQLEVVFETVDNLPTLPSIVLELEALTSSDSSSAEDVAELISADASLAVDVLKVVNSVALGGSMGEIVDIQMAVARMGMQDIKNLTMSLAISNEMSHLGEDLDHVRFWKHCFVSAITTRTLLSKCQGNVPVIEEEAYLAGLLHDIGMLILDQYFSEEFKSILTIARDQNCVIEKAERDLLEIDHGYVGGALLETWNIAEPVIEAVRWHHNPDGAPDEHRALARLVNVAEYICGSLDVGEIEGVPNAELDESQLTELGLEEEELPAIYEEVSREVEASAALLSSL